MFRRAQRGRFQGRLEITLQDGARRPFLIVREIRAVVGNAADHELLRAVAPFVHRRPAAWRHSRDIVEGTRPPALDAVRWVKPLEQSSIPPGLFGILKNGSTTKATAAVRANYFSSALSHETHEQHFRALLWIEEYRLR